jgi:hypothetical protein
VLQSNNCTEIKQAEREKSKEEVESGAMQNCRREVKKDACSKPSHTQKVFHLPKGPEEGTHGRPGPEEMMDRSPPAGEEGAEKVPTGSNSYPTGELDQPKSFACCKPLTIICPGHIKSKR